MRKAWKKAVSVLLTLVLIFGVLPGMNVSAEDEGGQGSGNSVEITLDNGTYEPVMKNVPNAGLMMILTKINMVQSNILQIIVITVQVLSGKKYRS